MKPYDARNVNFTFLVQIALLGQQAILDKICQNYVMEDQQAVSLLKITPAILLGR